MLVVEVEEPGQEQLHDLAHELLISHAVLVGDYVLHHDEARFLIIPEQQVHDRQL